MKPDRFVSAIYTSVCGDTKLSKRNAIAVLMALCGILSADFVSAQTLYCGDPPPVAEDELIGDIQGQAQMLLRYFGYAGLSGRIEKSRKEIFAKYKNATERSDAYFEYQVCVLLAQDKSLSTLQKIEE